MKLDIALTLNELEAIPMGLINNKQHIKAINFSNNNIKYIPEDIALFESLTDLNLSNNQIKIVPKVLEQLTKMQPNKLVLGIVLPIQMETPLNKSIVWNTALNLGQI